MPLTETSKLADTVLPDHEGHDVRLGDLWADGPVVLVWLRHYGWVHCRDHVVQLHRAREQLEDAGVRVALIGQANPRHAAAFRRKTGIDFPVLADDTRGTYKLAGLRRGNVSQLVGPRSVLAGVRHSARSGVVQGRVIGDVAQLGGAAVIRRDGSVAWSQAAENAADTVETEELLRHAEEAAAAA